MKFDRRIIRHVVTLVAVLLMLTMVVGARAQSKKVLRLAFTQEPGVLLDYFTDLGVSWTLNRIYAQPQWGMNANLEIVPTLLDELPSVENGGISQNDKGQTVVKFRIADWAVWSDGTPITAADFILPYEVATDGVSNVLSFRFVNGAPLESVTQGETEKDVIITFAGTQADWYTADFIPLPNHILREPYEAALAQNKGMDTLVDWLRAPTVGNGPFVFAEWQSGSFIRYVRNENYWKDVWFDEVVVNFYPDTNVIKQLLINGETDYTFAIPFLEAIELVNANDNLKLETGFSGGRMELRYNIGPNGNPALKDVRVRRAIAMGIDRQFIVDELYEGQSKIPRSFWDDTPWYYEGTPQVEYDPEGAVALLKEAGWYDEDGDGVVEAHGVEGVADGTPLKLKSSTYAGGGFTEYQDVLVTIQDMLKEIGVEISISLYEVNVMHSSWTSNSPYSLGLDDLYVQGWGVGVETIDQLELWECDAIPSEQNPNGWNGIHACYPEMDSLWDILGTSTDEAARQDAANKIQELMGNELFTLFLVNLNDAFVMRSDLEGGVWGKLNTPWLTLNEWKLAE